MNYLHVLLTSWTTEKLILITGCFGGRKIPFPVDYFYLINYISPYFRKVKKANKDFLERYDGCVLALLHLQCLSQLIQLNQSSSI